VSPAAPAGADAPSSGGPAQVETELLRRRWPEVLETMAGMRRATWALVSQNAQVGELTGTTLSLVFSSPGLATAFRNGSHADVVQRALVETLGVDVRVEGTLAGADAPGAAPPAAAPAPGAPPAPEPAPSSRPIPTVKESLASVASPPGGTAPSAPSPAGSAPPSSTAPPPWEVGGASSGADASQVGASPEEVDEAEYAQAMDEIDHSDPVLEDTGRVGVPLVAEMLGGTVIAEHVEDG